MHRKYHTPLSAWMTETGMTAPALAERLGVTRTAVYRWACGRGVPSSLHLADLLALAGNRLSVTDLTRPEVSRADHPA